MRPSTINPRPDYIGPDWLRCSDGYAFVASPPPQLRDDAWLRSDSLWERLVCVLLQAQAGDFRNVEALLEIAKKGDSVHLRDCAVRIFAQTAPLGVVDRLAEIFEHADHDARLEAYDVAKLTGDLRLARALSHHRAKSKGFERESTMDAISDMVEPDIEDLELVDNPLDDASYVARVEELVTAIEARYGEAMMIFHGVPLGLEDLAASIVGLCEEDEPSGGFIFDRLSLIEGMTGARIDGCLDDDCAPVFPRISHVLNRLRQDGTLERFVPGRRYFFGHPIPS